ncbi:MAG TPA: hypothetical protein VMF69_24035 [Gemmataceae bacterium]|nr:hypothetical protein [Gemmataceae bacterium]
MFSSLPDYSRFAEATIQSLREERIRKTADRFDRMFFNVVILAAVWGGLLYTRWFVLADIERAEHVPETIVGKWRTTDGSHFSIAFTSDGQFVLAWKETIVETARYWFNDGDQKEIVLSDFCKQPGDRLIDGEKMCWFRVSLAGKKLSTSFSWLSYDERFRKKANSHEYWKIKGEELTLPSAVFERVE